jgi:hypothetical protein
MASNKEEREMKRRKRFSIRLIALGFAAAAIAAPTGQAVPLDPDTNSVQHAGLYASAADAVVVSPDDRPVHATWAPQPSSVQGEENGFGDITIVSGIALLLIGGVGVALVVRSGRRGRLAPT